MDGGPHRPARLGAPRAEFCRAWAADVEGDVRQVRLPSRAATITQMLDGMAAMMREQQLPPLSDDLDPRDFRPMRCGKPSGSIAR